MRAAPPLLRRTVLSLAALAGLLAAPAQALIVPLTGWAPVGGDARFWTDADSACALREERHGQALPTFGTQEEARAFALRLHRSLSRSGVRDLVTQPVERVQGWGVLAVYNQEADGVTYDIRQLYLSDAGLLRTVTGSHARHEASACVNEMREFIRYQAN